MDKTRKKNIKKIIALVCAAAVVFLLAAMPLLARQDPDSDGPQASILSGTAQTGSIDTVLIGGGTLAQEDAVTISIPSAVKLTEFLVSNGDTVKTGDPIAAVDRVSVMTAIADVQETLDHLAEEIEAESEEDSDGEVEALAGGIVKILYAEEGDSVQDVMLTHGSLAVLSLDGLMAVDMTAESDLKAGSTVAVIFADGTEVSGKVETNLDGKITVTIEDDDYAIGEAVQVYTEDGAVIGSGELYIYSPWNATAYAGTVDDIEVTEGEDVDAGETLMELTNVGYTATYRQLVNQRQKYEALMLELFQMYQTELLTASCDGILSGVDKNSLQLLAAEEETYGIVLLANAPNGDDETAYTNFIGQVSSISPEGLALQLNPTPITVTDYKDLSTIPTDTSAMTQAVSYAASAPVYALSGDNWVQISTEALNPGDILLFACDESGGFVWVVRVIAAAVSEPAEPSEPTDPNAPTDPSAPTVPSTPADPSTPTDPSAPTDPSTPTDPSMPTDPSTPTDPSAPTDPSTPTNPGTPAGSITPTRPGGNQGTSPSMGGSWSSGVVQGGEAEQEEFALYALDMADIAAVTPQDTMQLDITVDELDITALEVGMAAKIQIDALGGEKFDAAISDISNTGESSGGNSKFTVTVTLNRSENMLVGMNATATIILDTASNILTVPADALVEDGVNTVIYTGYDEENEMLIDPVTVTVGKSDGQTVEILGGLDSGQVYYYAYFDTLTISFAPDFGNRSSGFMFGQQKIGP